MNKEIKKIYIDILGKIVTKSSVNYDISCSLQGFNISIFFVKQLPHQN